MLADARSSFKHVRFVFIDRDGVINRKPAEDRTISQWRDFEILPGVEEAIAQLNRTDHKAIIVTNQRGISLGQYSEQDLALLHEQLLHHLAAHGAKVDAIYYCPHDRDECDCRKPGPGMFLQAFAQFPGASPANSVIVGDSISDIEAGVRLGMASIFIHGDPRFQKPGAERAAALATATSHSLEEAVFTLLAPSHVDSHPSN